MGRLKYFVFAGIDFLIDKEGNPVFIEANSFPGALFEFEMLYGHVKPLEALIDLILSRVKEPKLCLIYRKKVYEKYNEKVEWKYRKLKRRVKTFLCFAEDQKSLEYLIDFKGRRVKPNVVLTPLLRFKQLFERDCWVINPIEVALVTIDKLLSTLIVKSLTRVRVPRTYLVRNKKDVLTILEAGKFRNGFVLKPRFGSSGKGIEVVFQGERWDGRIDGEYVLQERIEIEKQDGNFWDVRSYAIDGKFYGAIKRVSANPVVNISLGGRAERLEDELQEIVRKPTESAVRAIENFVKYIKRGRTKNKLYA